MKFTVTMKSPDAIGDALYDQDITDDERREFEELCERWFQYGEYVHLEIDTNKKTCVVKPF